MLLARHVLHHCHLATHALVVAADTAHVAGDGLAATIGLVWAILRIPGLLFSDLGASLEGGLDACSWDAVLFGKLSHVLVRIQDVATLVMLAMSRAFR